MNPTLLKLTPAKPGTTNKVHEFLKDFTKGDSMVIIHVHKTGNAVRYFNENATVAEINFLFDQAKKHLLEGAFDPE